MELLRSHPVEAILTGGVGAIMGLIILFAFVCWFENRQMCRFEQMAIEQGFVRNLTESHQMLFGPPQYYITIEYKEAKSDTCFYVEYEICENDYNTLKIDTVTRIRPHWVFANLKSQREYRFEQWANKHALLIGPLLLLVIVLFPLLCLDYAILL